MGVAGWLEIPELTLSTGEVVHLQGANGSGKTTLLRLIAGLTKPDSAAAMQGAQHPPHTVYLHQTPYLFRTTVRNNVEYGLKRCGLPLANADAAMQWAGVDALADTPCAQLSGGEQSRVALARVRALQPKLYLLDEPTAHLDADGARRVFAIINTLQADGATVVLSSHNHPAAIPATTHWHLRNNTLHISPAPA